MDRYRLTERGKLTLSIILVLVLLVIPSSIILTVATCSGAQQSDVSPSPASTQQTGDPGETDPAISSTPQPTPDSSPDPTPAETTEPTPTPEPPPPTPTPSGSNGGFGNGNGSEFPEYGPVGLNIAEGTMEFVFSPENQTSLDIETVAMLGEFLSSPKNTRSTRIRVEAPDLSDDYETALLSAVKRAFALYDISEDGLLFVSSGIEVIEQYFEVALSYAPITSQK